MSNTDTLSFEITLAGEYWDKAPKAKILIDDNELFSGEITATLDEPMTVNISADVEDTGTHKLSVVLFDKDMSQTIIENDEIVKDQLLHIKSVVIDDINIGGLIYNCKYKPAYNSDWLEEQRQLGNEVPEIIEGHASIGHNGEWYFEFDTPYYMWLLENLY